MQSTWVTKLSGFLALLGFLLLVKSVSTLISIYTEGPQIEWAAQSPRFDFALDRPGAYTISIKRTSLSGVIPNNNSFQVSNRESGETLVVSTYGMLLSKRTDVSGNRIVSVAEFEIDQPGSFRLTNRSTDHFDEKDKLIVATATGLKGVLMIVATVFSGVMFITGLIFLVLSLLRK